MSEQKSDMKQRAVVGLIVAAIAFVFLMREELTIALVVAAGLIFVAELVSLIWGQRHKNKPLATIWTLQYLVMGVIAMLTVIDVRIGEDGYRICLVLITSTAVNDIMAMVAGRYANDAKPVTILRWASPNKTWAGMLGGYIGGYVTFMLMWAALDLSDRLDVPGYSYVAIQLTLPLVAILGDLNASVAKRLYGVKDFKVGSVSLLHKMGGVADRIDSHVLVWVVYGQTLLNMAN